MTFDAVSMIENVNDGVVPPSVHVNCMYGARTGIDFTTLPVAVIDANESVAPSTLPKFVPSSDHWTVSANVGEVPETAVTSISNSRFAAPEPTEIADEVPVTVRAAEATKVVAATAASFMFGGREGPAGRPALRIGLIVRDNASGYINTLRTSD